MDNGYPVLSFYDDPDDRELVRVTQLMMAPQFVNNDVRPILRNMFHLETLTNKSVWEMEGVVEYAVEEIEEEELEQEL